MTTSADGTANIAAVGSQPDAEILVLQDVLQGLHGEANGDALGVYLRLESVGNDTIISVDPGAYEASIPIATIDNVIGMTLQQLLNNDLIT